VVFGKVTPTVNDPQTPVSLVPGGASELLVIDVERFYADHQAGVFRYLRRIVGGLDAARDLTQEVFLRVSKAGVPDSTPTGQRAWVFKIARNLALNHVRDGQRRPVVASEEEPVVPGTQELALALSAAIRTLPPLDRDIFLLRETAGLRYDEIAAACEVTESTVRTRLHQARQALRARLGDALGVRAQRGVRGLPAGPRHQDR
jgi:RNA polymerase sigma-70 factor (ECF subfamily)